MKSGVLEFCGHTGGLLGDMGISKASVLTESGDGREEVMLIWRGVFEYAAGRSSFWKVFTTEAACLPLYLFAV